MSHALNFLIWRRNNTHWRLKSPVKLHRVFKAWYHRWYYVTCIKIWNYWCKYLMRNKVYMGSGEIRFPYADPRNKLSLKINSTPGQLAKINKCSKTNKSGQNSRRKSFTGGSKRRTAFLLPSIKSSNKEDRVMNWTIRKRKGSLWSLGTKCNTTAGKNIECRSFQSIRSTKKKQKRDVYRK